MTITRTPDKEKAKEIREAIKANGGHCPCQLEKTSDTICICKALRESPIEGWCECGLYFKKLDN